MRHGTVNLQSNDTGVNDTVKTVEGDPWKEGALEKRKGGSPERTDGDEITKQGNPRRRGANKTAAGDRIENPHENQNADQFLMNEPDPDLNRGSPRCSPSATVLSRWKKLVKLQRWDVPGSPWNDVKALNPHD